MIVFLKCQMLLPGLAKNSISNFSLLFSMGINISSLLDIVLLF
jgi:hypothetical protein